MKAKNIAALLLVGMALAGMTYATAGQRSFAHNFATDESATFIVDMQSAKVHLILAGKSINNSEVAVGHIEHVHMIIDDEMLNEIAERNERIAEDIPAALDELVVMVEDGEDRSIIAGQFREISNLFAEAISVRIDPEHLEDPEVKALIVAGFVSNALAAYEGYHGVEGTDHSGHTEEEEGGEHDEGSMEHTEEGEHMEVGSSMHMNNDGSLKAAELFVILAKNAFYREHLADNGNTDALAARDGLIELREIIYGKQSIDDATVAAHINIHANLQKAFELEIAGEEDHSGHTEEEGGEHDEGSMEHTEEDEHGENSMDHTEGN